MASSGTNIDRWLLNERSAEWLYDLHHRFLLGDRGSSLTGSAELALPTLIVLAFAGWVEERLEPIRRTQEYNDAMVEGLDTVSGAGTGDWSLALERALAGFPSGTIRTSTVQNDFTAFHDIGIRQGSDRHPLRSSHIHSDSTESCMDACNDATALPSIEPAFNAALRLHTGRIDLSYWLLLTVRGIGLVFASSFGMPSCAGRLPKKD